MKYGGECKNVAFTCSGASSRMTHPMLSAERQAAPEAEMTSAALILQSTWLLKRFLNFWGTIKRSGQSFFRTPQASIGQEKKSGSGLVERAHPRRKLDFHPQNSQRQGPPTPEQPLLLPPAGQPAPPYYSLRARVCPHYGHEQSRDCTAASDTVRAVCFFILLLLYYKRTFCSNKLNFKYMGGQRIPLARN